MYKVYLEFYILQRYFNVTAEILYFHTKSAIDVSGIQTATFGAKCVMSLIIPVFIKFSVRRYGGDVENRHSTPEEKTVKRCISGKIFSAEENYARKLEFA